MPDQIIDAVKARAIQSDAVRTHPLAAWAVVRGQIDYPGKLVPRLVTDVITPYVLLADTLAGLHAHCVRSGSRLIRRKLSKRGSRRPLSLRLGRGHSKQRRRLSAPI